MNRLSFENERVRELFKNQKDIQIESIAVLKGAKTQDNHAEFLAKTRDYIAELARKVEKYRSKDGLTLVIVNTVRIVPDTYDMPFVSLILN